MAERPNILYIFTDQQYAGAMSCAGNPDLHTPAMDSVAQAGVLFEKTYCAFPLCTPSRASMFTGLMPHQVGVDDNNQPIAEPFRDRELGNVLSRAGYDCVYGGKWHIPEISIPEGHGFRRICGFSDWELADRCEEFLAGPHERPFFLVASFDNPHNICEWSRGTPLPWGPIPQAPVEQCPELPANHETAADAPEALAAEQAHLPRIFRAAAFDEADWRRLRHAYYRLIEKVDAEIGRILAALQRSGLAQNTLVIFSSDHGDGHGAHRWNQKWSLCEESVRVPLIVSRPGAPTAGSVNGTHLVSNGLDLFPTICDYAGAEPPAGLPGLSLRPLIDGNDAPPWRDHLVTETHFGPSMKCIGTRGRMVRTERHKYVLYDWGRNREQLHDLESDPGEMHNLAASASHRETLARHRSLLEQWIIATEDRFARHYAHPGGAPCLPGSEFVRPAK